jgi:MoaA/NifB/PqqE/SkfB family radical SAM enzyme
MSLRRRLLAAGYAVNGRVGRHVPLWARTVAHRLLHRPGDPMPPYLNVDVIGSCNLRCPSCPVGNTGPTNPTGLMAPDLLDAVVRKAAREYGVVQVGLFNWTEPLLHPKLPELIRVVNRAGLTCALSSNLNVMRNIDEVLRAKPYSLRISLSGFTQPVYSRTHKGGDVERVKANMRALAEAKARLGSAARVHVYYHKYRHNLHEVEPMRRFAAGLGFDWLESWAYYMPVERAIEVAEGTLPADQVRFVESQFALPIREAVAAAKGFKGEPCRIIDDITLDHRGNAVLCCGVYDQAANRLGHFLDLSPAQMAAAKAKHRTCGRCAKHGVHAYVSYLGVPGLKDIYDGLAAANLAAGDPAPGRVELPVVG